MAEEFQAALYGGSWWMSPRTACDYLSCSSSDILEMENLGVPFWSKDLMDKKSKSSDESSDDSMVFQDIQKPGGCTTTITPDSAYRMVATVFSDLVETATIDWNQNLSSRVQEEMNTFSTSGDDGLKTEIEAEHQVLTVDAEQQSLCFATNSISSPSYGYPSSLVQSLLTNSSPPQQQPLYDHHLTNNTPFLSASASPFDNNISSFFPSLSTQFLSKSYNPNLRIEHNHAQEIRDLGSPAKKGPEELPFKRPRLETPSPLPTFKVRKEKLGDRITALQQLVSPFGKTDTASVLHEAIEYIKLLHDQVNIFSAPYMKGATKQLQPIHDKVKDDQEHKHDLRSLGLCLVPVSSMFPVTTEMTTGFWTPSYEGSFK